MAKKENHTIGYTIAFGEIFLKSPGVMKILTRKLNNNLAFFLKKNTIKFKIQDFRTRLFIETDDRKAIPLIKNTFGIVWYAKSILLKNSNLKETSSFISSNYEQWIKPKQTFALRVKKDSNNPQGTIEIIDSLAKQIKRKVDLNNPSRTVFIEQRKNNWIIYFKKNKGPGGLPVGSQGKVLSLMSGGIDSPVAAHQIARRGAANIWIHFHSFPLVSKKSIEKIGRLAEKFLKFQPRLKVYSIPFANIQTKIKNNVDPKYRVILYRRLMLKIAEKVAQEDDCKALVTGESLGQVSSQTLSNMKITEEAVTIPVLRPLISWDKAEIIQKGKEIDTYDITIEPHEDCCTLFTPKHACASANLKKIKEIEKSLKFSFLIRQSISNKEEEIFS